MYDDALADPDPDGTEAAAADAPTPPPPMTPKLLEILRRMVPADPDGEPPWMYASELGRETDIPRGTVTPLLQRLETHGWAESLLDDVQHVRRFRLTDAGVEGARAEIAAAPAPELPRRDVTRSEPVRHEATRRDPSRGELPPVPAKLIAEAPPGGRGWVMDDLASLNPDLAAAIRRKLAAGEGKGR